MLYIAYLAFNYLALFGFLALQASFVGLIYNQTIFYLITGFISTYILITCKTIAANIGDAITKQSVTEFFADMEAREKGLQVVKDESSNE